MKGMSISDFKVLLKCGKSSPDVYMWDAVNLTAHRPAASVLCWPVEFLLTLHRKHVLRTRKAPDLARVGQSLSNWYHRQKWKLFYAGEDTNRWRHLRARRRITPACPHNVSPQVEAHLQYITNGIWQACRVARGRFFSHRHSTSNVSDVHRLALDILKFGTVGILPADKDGGYCLVA